MNNFLIRALVAVIAIPALLWVFQRGGWWLWGLVGVFVSVSCIEIWRVARQNGIPYVLPIGLFLTLSLSLVAFDSHVMLLAWSAMLLVLTGAVVVWRRDAHSALLALLTHIGSAIWIGFGFASLLLLRKIDPHGVKWIVFLYANLWIGDTAAYLFGRMIGGPKLSPVISPNKTIAGAIAQVIVSGLIGVVYVAAGWIDIPAVQIITAALLVGIVGQIGDLFESVIKRAAGVKDFSSIIPGHGGVLDRFDSTLVAGPALWALLFFWGILGL